MICVKNPTAECSQMEKPCDYPKEYDKAIDTMVHSMEKYIPFCTYDSDCDTCPVLRTQLACIIIGDLLDNEIIVKEK